MSKQHEKKFPISIDIIHFFFKCMKFQHFGITLCPTNCIYLFFYISVASKRGCSRIKHFQIESQKSQNNLMEDLSVLAMLTLPYEFQFQWHYWMELPMRPKALGCNEFIDIIFRIGSHIFQCHKAMFCTRSDYFKASLYKNV